MISVNNQSASSGKLTFVRTFHTITSNCLSDDNALDLFITCQRTPEDGRTRRRQRARTQYESQVFIHIPSDAKIFRAVCNLSSSVSLPQTGFSKFLVANLNKFTVQQCWIYQRWRNNETKMAKLQSLTVSTRFSSPHKCVDSFSRLMS